LEVHIGMIRDLKYPEDARKELTSLCDGLAYDASIAVAGETLSKIPLHDAAPDFTLPFRCGGLEQDQAVRRAAPTLFARFSLISMISRFETHAFNLLRQRRVLEHCHPNKRMDGPSFWKILTRIQQESKPGPVKMCDGLVVVQPSAALKSKMEWLEGLYRVRNCLAHRLGTVQMIDVKPSGVPLDQTKDDDTLKAIWLRPRVLLNGKEIQLPYSTTEASQLTFDFEPYVREWRIGAQIDVSPQDCQAIAISLSMLGQQLQTDFEGEMDVLLGIPAPTHTARGK
jgi:hypothetical protein